jgi:hypothetical protein
MPRLTANKQQDSKGYAFGEGFQGSSAPLARDYLR